MEESLKSLTGIEFVPRFLELVDLQSTQPIQVKGSRGFVGLGPIRELDTRRVAVGAFFYAGGRWSRSNRYELTQRNGTWGITKFENLMGVVTSVESGSKAITSSKAKPTA
jgi:hypothetical protein